MKRLEKVDICNGLASLLLLRIGDREYYIDPEAGIALEGLEEAEQLECSGSED